MPPEHKSKELQLCTGRERLTKYEQEGLVPFVGKLNSHKRPQIEMSWRGDDQLSIRWTSEM